MVWVIFANLHVNDSTLEALEPTLSWITTQCEKINPSTIYILGNLMHEHCSAAAYKRVLQFLSSFKAPVHLLMGSSDAKELHHVPLPNVSVHTKSLCIGNVLLQSNFTARGLLQNSLSDQSNTPSSEAVSVDTSSIIFTGASHNWQQVSSKLCCVGAVKQFHFGDIGQDRGITLFDPVSTQCKLFVNPHATQFYSVQKSEIDTASPATIATYKGKYIQIATTGDQSVNRTWLRKFRLKFHPLGVKIVSVELSKEHLQKQRDECVDQLMENKQHEDLYTLFDEYIEQVPMAPPESDDDVVEDDADVWRDAVRDCMNTILNFTDMHADIPDEEPFNGAIKSVTVRNFLGIEGNMTWHLDQMNDGIWFICGANGSGKSLLLECITWGLFSKCLRSNMKMADSINDAFDELHIVIIFANGYKLERNKKRQAEKMKNLHWLHLFDPTGKAIHEPTLGATQEKLNRLMGVTYDQFVRCSVLSWDQAVTFAASAEHQKREMLEQFLGFDSFPHYEKAARALLDNEAKEYYAMQKEIDRVQHQMDVLVDELKDTPDVEICQEEIATKATILQQLTKQLGHWNDMEASIQEVDEELTPLMQKQHELHTQWQALVQSSKDAAQRSILERHKLYLQMMLDLCELQNRLEKSLTAQRSILPQIMFQSHSLEQSSIAPLQNFLDSTVKPRLQGAQKADLLDELKTLQARTSTAALTATTSSPTLEAQLYEELRTVKDQIAVLQREKTQYSDSVKTMPPKEQIQMDMQMAVAYLAIRRTTLDNLIAESTINEKYFDLEDELKERQEKLALTNTRRECLKYCLDTLTKWTRHPEDGFRNYCLQNQLQSFNRLLQINIELMNQDGSSGSQVHHLDCKLNDRLQLEACGDGISLPKRSAGQKQRTNLSIFFTIFTLAQKRLSFKMPFLFLDEIFDHLDHNGRLTIQKWILESFQQVPKVFIVTHQSQFIPQAQGFITAYKHPAFGSCYKAFDRQLEKDLTEASFTQSDKEEVLNSHEMKKDILNRLFARQATTALSNLH